MNYAKVLKSNYKLIITIVLILAILVLAITALQTFKYQATARLLIIQKQTANIDAYTAAKSGERIAKNLAEIIYTSSFYDNVIDSNPNLKAEFSSDETERRKEWEKNISAVSVPESGILEISAYHSNPEYAAQLVRSIAYVLVNKGGDYHGGGKEVEIKIVDNVFVSKYPMRPNIFLNLSLAIMVGLIIGLAYSVLREIRKQNKQLALSFEEKQAVEPVVEPKKFVVVQPVENKPEKVKITTFYDHIQSLA